MTHPLAELARELSTPRHIHLQIAEGSHPGTTRFSFSRFPPNAPMQERNLTVDVVLEDAGDVECQRTQMRLRVDDLLAEIRRRDTGAH